MSIKKTFTCTNCGKEHAFGAYVAAHAHVLLTHTCECGQKHSVLNYRVKPLHMTRQPTSIAQKERP